VSFNRWAIAALEEEGAEERERDRRRGRKLETE